MKRALLTAAVLGLAGCRDHLPPPADEYVVDCRAVNPFVLCAPDSYYIAMIEADEAGDSKVDACASPELLTPAPGSTLDPSAPPLVTFNRVHASCLRERMTAPRGVLARSDPWRWLSSLIEPEAQAHALPAAGENYLLRIRPAGQTTAVYTAQLSTSSFTPDAQIWSHALGSLAGQSVELSIERAAFTRDSMTAGPFVAPSPAILSVAP